MAAFAGGLETFCLWLARASWQGSILIGLVLVLQWALRRVVAPQHLYALWLLVLVRLALPVSIESSFSIFNTSWIKTPAPIAKQNRPEVVAYRVLDNAASTKLREKVILPSATWVQPQETEKPPWTAFIPLVWLLGCLALVTRVAWRNYGLSDRLRRAPPVTDSAVLQLIQRCRQSAAIRQPLWVIETAEVRSPALFGILVPRLLLPEGLINRFTPGELRFIVMHELEHVRRMDIALNWIVTGLLALHWFNPIVWFAFKRLRSDREVARDANVLRQLPPEEAPAYGNTILKLVEGFVPQSPSPGVIGILETNARLRRRLSMIARFQNPVPLWSWLARGAAIVLAFVTLTDAGIEARLPVVPEVEQTPRELTVNVVDAETWRAIPGATLGPRHTTDAEGKAVILRPATLVIRAEGYVSVTLNLATPFNFPEGFVPTSQGRPLAVTTGPGNIPDRMVVKLQPAETIGGIVQDREGNPIGNVEIYVTGAVQGIWSYGGCVAKTDAQGRWVCSEMTRNADAIVIRLLHPEHAEAFYYAGGSSDYAGGSLEFPLPAGVHTLPIEELKTRHSALAMDRGLDISGRVLDLHGRPVEGAEVSHGDWHGRPAGKITTAKDGHFHFANGRSGTTILTVRREGFVTATERIFVMPRANPFLFHLVRGRVVRGRVVDEEGKPVSGASVSANPPTRWFEKTGKDGSFFWSSAPAKPVQISVHAPGYAPSQGVLNLEAGDRDYEIQLRKIKEIKISGIVAYPQHPLAP